MLDFWQMNVGPFLPDIGVQLLNSAGESLFISRCSTLFQLVKGLDCKRDSSAPRRFYYEAMLL